MAFYTPTEYQQIHSSKREVMQLSNQIYWYWLNSSSLFPHSHQSSTFLKQNIKKLSIFYCINLTTCQQNTEMKNIQDIYKLEMRGKALLIARSAPQCPPLQAVVKRNRATIWQTCKECT